MPVVVTRTQSIAEKILSAAERFGSLYAELQAALPRGDMTAGVRTIRKIESTATLGDTLGQ